MLIRDLVQPGNVTFVPDVQLAWYPDNPDNMKLVEGYIFTHSAVSGALSSIALLDKF